jgi:hypothetical protein
MVVSVLWLERSQLRLPSVAKLIEFGISFSVANVRSVGSRHLAECEASEGSEGSVELLIDIASFAAVIAVPVALLDVFLTVRARRQKI